MTPSEINSGKRFQIGPMMVDPNRNHLRNGDNIYPLEPRIMDVLQYLAAHSGKVCARDDIISAIWQVEFGADESLTRAISVLRKKFRTAGGRGRYIQTISKRGYCLLETPRSVEAIAQIEPEIASQPPAQTDRVPQKPAAKAIPANLPKASKPKNLRSKFLASGASLFLLALLGLSFLQKPSTSMLTPETNLMEVSEYGRSVAVMPFVDMSPAQDQNHFSLGMSEELSNELGKIPSLRLLGRGSLTSVRDAEMSYKVLGNKFQVSHVIDGSVRKQGDNVKIFAQVVNTSDGRNVWSNSYAGTLENGFDLQERVSKDIALQLTLLLSLDIQEPIDIEVLTLSATPKPR